MQVYQEPVVGDDMSIFTVKIWGSLLHRDIDSKMFTLMGSIIAWGAGEFLAVIDL